MPKKNKISLLTRGKVHTTEEPYPNGTQAFVPIKQINDGIICTKDGRYVKILEVLPVNFHLKSSMEQETMIYYFASYLKISPDHLQILVRTPILTPIVPIWKSVLTGKEIKTVKK